MLAVIDPRMPIGAVKALRRRGYEICPLPPHPALPSPIASHPDLLLFFAPDRILCTKSYARLAERELTHISRACQKPICVTEQDLGAVYPQDILLDALPIGNRLFCHAAHTARELTDGLGYRRISVRQGYAKCATIPITENALITADPSIASAANEEGLDVLKIESGHITLKGYDTGLIGGVASYAPYCASHEILFCGALDTHPSAALICEFCEKHGKRAVSLSNDPLTDVGTVFLISSLAPDAGVE